MKINIDPMGNASLESETPDDIFTIGRLSAKLPRAHVRTRDGGKKTLEVQADELVKLAAS